jgi:hypothetical protein
MNAASLCSLAGLYDNPIPTRCLAPIDFYKIPAQVTHPGGTGSLESILELLKSLKIGLWWAGTINPILNRFLAPIDCLKFPAQKKRGRSGVGKFGLEIWNRGSNMIFKCRNTYIFYLQIKFVTSFGTGTKDYLWSLYFNPVFLLKRKRLRIKMIISVNIIKIKVKINTIYLFSKESTSLSGFSGDFPFNPIFICGALPSVAPSPPPLPTPPPTLHLVKGSDWYRHCK